MPDNSWERSTTGKDQVLPDNWIEIFEDTRFKYEKNQLIASVIVVPIGWLKNGWAAFFRSPDSTILDFKDGKYYYLNALLMVGFVEAPIAFGTVDETMADTQARLARTKAWEDQVQKHKKEEKVRLKTLTSIDFLAEVEDAVRVSKRWCGEPTIEIRRNALSHLIKHWSGVIEPTTSRSYLLAGHVGTVELSDGVYNILMAPGTCLERDQGGEDDWLQGNFDHSLTLGKEMTPEELECCRPHKSFEATQDFS